MDEFMQKLLALRNSAGNVAKGTFDNMASVGERSQEMVDTDRERNQALMTQAFGSPEAYLDLQDQEPELPKTPGQSLGDFLERIKSLRDPVYYQRQK